jgi:hypothetical protein
MTELLESYQARIEVYENTKDRPAEDHHMWESIEIARSAILTATQDLVNAIEHLKVCRRCAEGDPSGCPYGKKIEKLLRDHKPVRTGTEVFHKITSA